MTAADLDIVLPCYNPQPGWTNTVVASLEKLQKHLPEVRFHLYVVNDGSVKNVADSDIHFLTQNLPSFTYIILTQNQGKGSALRAGVAQTKHQFCLYTDIDFPYQETSMADVFNAMLSGMADVAVGTRDTDYYQQLSAGRTRLSKWLRSFAQNILQLPVSDTQAGLKGFNRKGKEIFLQTTIKRYLFDLEFLLLATKQPNLRMEPVPVVLKPNIEFSNMSPEILLKEAVGLVRSLAKRKSAEGK